MSDSAKLSADQKRDLERFVVDDDDLEQLEALLAEFNIFEAIGVVRQELRHSDFLAFLLDPTQNHGLDDVFLKRFLKGALSRAKESSVSAVDIDVADLDDAEIVREWRNLDICIRSPGENLVCVVENKVDSTEHSDQLRRYGEIVAGEFAGWKSALVYLTPDGTSPKEDGPWIPFSYAGVATLVDSVRKSRASTLGADVHALLQHYVTMLRRHIVSDSEVADLCRKIYRKHKKALDLIYEHRPDMLLDMKEFLVGLIEDAPSGRVALDHSIKNYIRFRVKEWDARPGQLSGHDWTPSKRVLLFEFQNLVDGLALKLIIGPGEDKVRETLYAAAKADPKVYKGALGRFTKMWTQIYKKPFLSRKDYEAGEIEQMKSKVRERWAEFLARDLEELTQGLQWPAAEPASD